MFGGQGQESNMSRIPTPSCGTSEIISADFPLGQVWPNPSAIAILTRLLTLLRAGLLHWTLAFHATDRPDDPPIGVWKFGRTDFDDANFGLQQRHGYAYARITSLESVATLDYPNYH